MSAELAEYKAEASQIRNQDLTIRKLEEKIHTLEAAAEDRDREAQRERDKAAAEADAARMAQMQVGLSGRKGVAPAAGWWGKVHERGRQLRCRMCLAWGGHGWRVRRYVHGARKGDS